ncbi:hypothetical protein NA57DRAFT_79504 [Rhizodiscina lignyota]|uniref:Carboxymuconolactone decarboxylase-like domain-containing protein n=1 Tax=Rhizodiscina lignyota TaxID=1504668 RepID=A0A9P4I9S4_9PEZI|nr:hypothetical protein NA57DRAFT_79504 [Rhizodiscina lignyota]
MSPRLPTLPVNLPGMLALGAYRPDVYMQLAALADNMLRTSHPESTLIPSEREMIATYVSSLNRCNYCATIHGAVAAAHICNANTESTGQDPETLKTKAEETVNTICIRRDIAAEETEASPKLKRLLKIASQVRDSGLNITPEAVADAKESGATDMDIHDTVLIAALFCMFNRYVDGLTGAMPDDVEKLKGGGQMIADRGYAARTEAMKVD